MIQHSDSPPGWAQAGPEPSLVRGRKFSGDDVALLLLSLLADEPAHGYALRQALEARSQGYYVPSPGVLYPALALLQERGWADVSAHGTRKAYAATPAGLDHLQAEQARLARLWALLDHAARKTAWLRRTWSKEPQALGPDGEDPASGWLPEFVAARRALKEALLLRSAAAPAQQRQLAAILARAAADIETACPLSPSESASHD
ncbi:helix-turn-helix transcriptional regulator [Achromobacter sp. GG226]|uniref:PadR family transcriptional regulator n=1 Tax=Verticiella alkaliphila TaxID=2779529 RepID=UPI001C0DF7BC|nr:PadR family transcriptional regulator [Verticiella sp. GG226]MBU4610129.1 helix-turn-helix transcriptional regulator [Verticiella sp. GG226]